MHSAEIKIYAPVQACQMGVIKRLLEMGRFKESWHLRRVGQLALETFCMSEPDLPHAAGSSGGNLQRVSFSRFDVFPAEAAWTPLDRLNLSHSLSRLFPATALQIVTLLPH